MGFLGSIIVGLIAGWLAEKATSSDHGLLTNLVVGVIGGIVGGQLANLLGIQIGPGWIAQIVVATAGAVLLLFVWRAIRGRS